MTVFLDANILFSASFTKSAIHEFLTVIAGAARLVTSEYAVAEAKRNLTAKKPSNLADFEKFVKTIQLVPVQPFDPGVAIAEKDRPILCGAIACRASFLLTGDKKDFGHLYGKIVRGVKIMNVGLLVDELIERGILRED